MSNSPGDVWGPVAEGRGRRRRRRVLVATLTLLVVLVAGGLAAALWMGSQVPRTEVSGLADPGTPLHVLVIGSDSREELTPEERRELSTGYFEGERADTIFVLTMDRGRAAILALPRDLWVERCDGSMGRINGAIEIDGPSCMVDTVRRTTGIPVHHFAKVTFGGFRSMVDAVGGVELCLPEAISDRDAGIDLPAGCQRLDGADALGFVRVRNIDDDLQRIVRQKTFVQALAAEMTAPRNLLHPVRMYTMAQDAGGAVTVDQGMGLVSQARIAWGVRGLARGAMTTVTVPVTPRTTSAGAAVLDLDADEAEPIFARFRSGAVLDDMMTPTRVNGAANDPQPGEVSVMVLNGAGVAGLASMTAEHLEDSGFAVVGLGNADRRATTVVRYPPSLERHATLVARSLGLDDRLEPSEGVSVVTVLLGEDQGDTA